MIFTGSKKDVAAFVAELLSHSIRNLRSITITRLVKSEDYSVSIAIGMLSADTIVALGSRYSLKLMSI